jgi:hypothetical protein
MYKPMNEPSLTKTLDELVSNVPEQYQYKLKGLLKEITHFTEEDHFGIYDFDKADFSKIDYRELNYAWACWYRSGMMKPKYFKLKVWLDKYCPKK